MIARQESTRHQSILAMHWPLALLAVVVAACGIVEAWHFVALVSTGAEVPGPALLAAAAAAVLTAIVRHLLNPDHHLTDFEA